MGFAFGFAGIISVKDEILSLICLVVCLVSFCFLMDYAIKYPYILAIESIEAENNLKNPLTKK